MSEDVGCRFKHVFKNAESDTLVSEKEKQAKGFVFLSEHSHLTDLLSHSLGQTGIPQ